LLFSFSACKNSTTHSVTECKSFSINSFDPITNFKGHITGNKVNIALDYNDAFNNGFVIPSVNQINNGNFEFNFFIKNLQKRPQVFYYKVFYQNETYKFSEKGINSSKENELASENFYGSWEDTGIGFKSTCEIPSDGNYYQVNDIFRIVGNPRNEIRYFSGDINERWKRNPRVGDYSFLIVILNASDLNKLPLFIKDISKTHCNSFVNPYYYFLYGQGSKLKNTVVLKSEKILNVVAKPELSNGVYIKDEPFYSENNAKYMNKFCGNSDKLYKNAVLKHFAHFIDPAYDVKNIPVIADIINDNYSRNDYNLSKSQFKKEQLIDTKPKISDSPCRDIIFDSASKKLIINSPASNKNNFVKQNIGVITRHGFAYGKYTVKVKMHELLNKNDVWNGITNAIWLITASTDSWNNRRTCYKKGYLSNYYGDSKDKRVWTTSYSEIDIEILKSAYNCGHDKDNSENGRKPLPYDYKNEFGNIMINCTNWDMACPEPQNYGVGCQEVKYNNMPFNAHRWDYWYKAITEKAQAKDDELFGKDYYYFQIEWKPTEIIWRVGPEKNKLAVVGFMNDNITSIPNNQMLLIISQEFHDTKWWPGSPYEQQFIPFPKNDIKSEILEIEIE
jgi:hypothetical protein